MPSFVRFLGSWQSEEVYFSSTLFSTVGDSVIDHIHIGNVWRGVSNWYDIISLATVLTCVLHANDNHLKPKIWMSLCRCAGWATTRIWIWISGWRWSTSRHISLVLLKWCLQWSGFTSHLGPGQVWGNGLVKKGFGTAPQEILPSYLVENPIIHLVWDGSRCTCKVMGWDSSWAIVF